SVGADQAGDLALRDSEGARFDRLHTPEMLVQVLHLEERGHAAPVSRLGPVMVCSTATVEPPLLPGSSSRRRRSGMRPRGRKRMNRTRTTPVRMRRIAGAKLG